MDYGIVAANLNPVYDPADVTLCVACLRLYPSPFPVPKLNEQMHNRKFQSQYLPTIVY